MKTRFTVIVPVYNVEDYISKTIQSLINQRYKNFEFILIDDGSTDNSINVAKSILDGSDLDFKIIHQKNQGVSVARNRGINEASGEYIYFLDSDDYVHEDLLYRFNEEIKNTNADILYCGFDMVEENGKVINSSNVTINGNITGRDMATKMIYGEAYINMIVGVYKKSIIKKNGIAFDKDRKVAEDFAFTIKCLLESELVKAVDERLVYYVRRKTSVMNKASISRIDSYYSHKDIVDYLEKKQDTKNQIRAMKEYRIPTSIIGIFNSLSASNKLEKELDEFINDYEVKNYLKRFKVKEWNVSNIKYYILGKGIILWPRMIRKYYGNKRS